ncbi:MAG: hypothetical protein V1855_02465 [bacterium]
MRDFKYNTMSKNNLIIGLAAAFVIAAVVAAVLHADNKKLTTRVGELKRDNLRLLLEAIRKNPNLSDELKRQLEKLVKQFANVDIKISNELAEALQLLQIGQTENAIEDLVKIIEHLLTVHYQEDTGFKAWIKKEKKKFDLFGMLTYCKTERKISEIEYQFFLAIKKIRDKEDHTIDFNIDQYLKASGLITAIGGILKVATIVYPNQKLI